MLVGKISNRTSEFVDSSTSRIHSEVKIYLGPYSLTFFWSPPEICAAQKKRVPGLGWF